jgi:hypothetical protein
MTHRIAAFAALALSGATAAFASIPEDLEERTRSGIVHVCRDREPGQADYVVCVEQAVLGDPESEYTASECTAAGLPAVCTIDFLPKVKITGTMLVVNDDFAEDEEGGSDQATAVVLDVKARNQTQRIVEIFAGDEIGHWNSFTEAFLVDPTTTIEFSDAEKTAFNFASENLIAAGDELKALAQAAYPTADLTGTIALLTSVKRAKPKKSLDHSGADPLASAASFKIVVQFARVRN